MGVPPSSVNCFAGADFRVLLLGAMRVPKPAAGMMTSTFMAGDKYTSPVKGVQISEYGAGVLVRHLRPARRYPPLKDLYLKRQIFLGIFADRLHQSASLD